MKKDLLCKIIGSCSELTFIKIDNYDKAVIGITELFDHTDRYSYHVLVYSLSKIIKIMQKTSPSSSLIECLDDYNYNILGSLKSLKHAPIIVDDIF